MGTALTAPPPRWLIPGAIVALAAFYLWFAFAIGPINTPDGVRDSAYARALAVVGYDPLRYLNEAQQLSGFVQAVQMPFYLTYVYLLSGLIAVFGEGWAGALLVVNALAYTGVAALVLPTIARATNSAAAVAGAAILFAALFDFLQWLAMTQSDPLFVALAATAFVATLQATGRPRGQGVYLWWMLAGGALGIAILSRPTWPPLAATIGIAALFAARPPRDIVRGGVLWTGALILLAFAALIAAAFAYRNATLPAGSLRDAIALYSSYMEQGVVVLARPEFNTPPPGSLLDRVHIMLVRIVYFFWFDADGLSAGHRLLNWIGHVPLYCLAAVGAAGFVRGFLPNRWAQMAALLSVWLILLTATFHSMMFVDFDWRYRAPVYPALILLAALGIDSLARSLRRIAIT